MYRGGGYMQQRGGGRSSGLIGLEVCRTVKQQCELLVLLSLIILLITYHCCYHLSCADLHDRGAQAEADSGGSEPTEAGAGAGEGEAAAGGVNDGEEAAAAEATG